jgi:DNA/RNA endonuclease G (NUC1)
MSEALKLTEFGKFIVKHSVVVPTTFWQVIFAKTKKLLDNADTGEEAEDAWQMFLTELRDGCNELLTNDEFLRILHADHGESDE